MDFRNFYIKTIWRYCAHFSKKSPTPWIFWIHSVFADQWKHTFYHFQNQQTSRLNLKNCLFFNIFQAESCFEVVSELTKYIIWKLTYIFHFEYARSHVSDIGRKIFLSFEKSIAFLLYLSKHCKLFTIKVTWFKKTCTPKCKILNVKLNFVS